MASIGLISTAVLLLSSIPVRAGVAAPINLSGQWTMTMTPDFKGNQTDKKCTISQRDQHLSVRCGSRGDEMTGTVNDRHAEWKRPLQNGGKVTFTADIGEADKTVPRAAPVVVGLFA